MRARTWEIHIPELRPGPARNQLGAGDGAGGGSKTANMRKKHVCRARFIKYTFPSSGRGRPGTSSGPVMGLAGGRKVRTWARNVGVEHGLSTFCVFCVFLIFRILGPERIPKKDPLGSLKMIKKRWCREGFGAFGNPYRFGLTFPCSKTFSRPTFLHFSGFLRGTFFQPGRGEKSSAQKVAQMSHETLAWPSEIDFEI